MGDIKLPIYKVYFRKPLGATDFEFVEAGSMKDAKLIVEDKYKRVTVLKVVRVQHD